MRIVIGDNVGFWDAGKLFLGRAYAKDGAFLIVKRKKGRMLSVKQDRCFHAYAGTPVPADPDRIVFTPEIAQFISVEKVLDRIGESA